MEAPFLALLSIAGVINAWILGAVLLLRKDYRRSPANVRLALFLLGVGFLLGAFIFWYFDWMPYTLATRIAYDTVALLTAALFLDHVVCALGRKPIHVAAYAPAVIYVLVGAAFGEPFVQRVTIAHLVFAQMVYSAVATSIAFRTHKSAGKRQASVAVVAAPLLAIWSLHAVQVLRILLPENRLVFDAVPFVGAAILIALNVYVLGDPAALKKIALRPLSAVVNVPVSLAELEHHLAEQRPYLDPALTAESLASAVGITSRQLSYLLNRDAGCSFYEFLQRYRVAEAKALLQSPQEHRTSIEAIGLMAGFRSRSTFYEAFRRETGASPAQFRREHAT